MTPDPATLLADLSQRIPRRHDLHPVVAYWMKATDNRQRYAEQLTLLASGLVVPLVVTAGFQNPNAVANDLGQLIRDNRGKLEGVPPPTESHPLVLVLLSRTEFGVNDVTSPTLLPDWLPGLGGRTALIRVEDLTWRIEVAANHPDVQTADLRERLFRLDRAVTARLRIGAAAGRTPNPQGELGKLLVGAGAAKTLEGLLSEAEQEFDAVSDPAEFRLALRAPRTPLAAMVSLASDTPAKRAVKAAGELSHLLALPPSADDRPTLVALLAGLNTLEKTISTADRFCWNLIITAHAAHRLSTIAAHAAEVPCFPAPLLQSACYEIRKSLAYSAEQLVTLSLS